MNIRFLLFLGLLSLILISCEAKSSKLQSPDKNITVKFQLSPEGRFFYTVAFKEKSIIDTSYVGFDFKNAPSLSKGFVATIKDLERVDDTWQIRANASKKV